MDFGFGSSTLNAVKEVNQKGRIDAADIVALNQGLLNAIVGGDYETYNYLCTDDMTCFEPEACDSLVEGKGFHKFYFTLPSDPDAVKTQVTMSNVHVRKLGADAFVVSYVRLNQMYGNGKSTTNKSCETRIWERKGDKGWKNVHVHRS